MALQPCRTAFLRTRACHALPCLRTYATAAETTTTTTPSRDAFKEAFAKRRWSDDDYTPELQVKERSTSAQDGENSQRWRQTPQRMQAALRMDFAKKKINKVWRVNANPEKLNIMYDKLLGPNGSKMLPEELKWLAVTHKSFDQGRRGFNDRLALMGRFTLMMEANKYIISKGSRPEVAELPDEFDRTPFENAQLQSVDNLSIESAQDFVSKEALHALARGVGMMEVMRWKPRLTTKLMESGLEVVLNGAIMAIVGAITLQHGSEVAGQVVRERILNKIKKE